MRASSRRMSGDSAGGRPTSWIWLGLGLMALSGLAAAGSCAPVEQVVVGDLTAQGGGGGAPPCVSDGGVCTGGAECCSGACTAGACAALSTQCLTSGNACVTSEECCSGLCDTAGHCGLGSSYCAQPDDVCRSGADCCTGVCEVAEGATLGVCGAAPSGASNCSAGVAGLLCGDCNQCCSRLCAPYGDGTTSICTAASGCKVTGEICERDADCCGGDAASGLPGAGNSGCDRAEGAAVGVCRNAMGCSPLGNVCHMVDYACSVSSASNRCCDGATPGICLLDASGIPRCGTEGDVCRAAGESCATSTECCDGRPCTLSEEGSLRCQSEVCAPVGDSCTAASDCCTGLTCRTTVGSLAGECQEEAP